MRGGVHWEEPVEVCAGSRGAGGRGRDREVLVRRRCEGQANEDGQSDFLDTEVRDGGENQSSLGISVAVFRWVVAEQPVKCAADSVERGIFAGIFRRK